MTSWPSLRKDLENAGASWEDSEVVEDGGLITSRKPDDIPAFTQAVIRAVAGGVRDMASIVEGMRRDLHPVAESFQAGNSPAGTGYEGLAAEPRRADDANCVAGPQCRCALDVHLSDARPIRRLGRGSERP